MNTAKETDIIINTENKKLISYEKYKYNLFVIKEFCANKNDKTLKELKELVKDDNSLQSKVISKLFIQD